MDGAKLLRRLSSIALIVASLSMPSARASSSAVEELMFQRQLALAELDQAKDARRSAWLTLHAQRKAYKEAYHQLQAASAAIWMGTEPSHVVDVAYVDGLRSGVAMARSEVTFAGYGVTQAKMRLSELEGKLAVAKHEARLERHRNMEQRVKQAARQERSATISCPVAQVSAIYADFGAPRPSGPHRGIDIPAPDGSPALAAWYTRVRETVTGGWMGKGIVLEDSAGNTWWYAHLARIDVEVGDVVARGQQIGLVGSTGNSTGPHLHFEIHARGVTPVDPYTLVAPACGAYDSMTPQERVAYEASTDDANGNG